jgi:integrase
MAALTAGTWTDDEGTTVGAWLDTWLDGPAAKGRSPNTLANYRGHVRDVWRPQLGEMKLRDVRRSSIERALASLVGPIGGERPAGNVGRRVQQRSGSTIEGYRRTIRAALSAAKRRELIAVNPAEGRIDAIPDRDHDDELAFWQPEQTALFLEYVATDRLSALYETAASAGLRRAELCGARWSDLDEDGAGLTIRQTIVEITRRQAGRTSAECPVCGIQHVGRLFKPPKSRAGRRWVPLASPAQQALARHRVRQQDEREFYSDDYSDHGLIFCRPDGTPLRPGSVTTAFEAHVTDCGLSMIRLHDTRHGACSLLLAGGVPIEIVQMILGHSSPAVTRKIYRHTMRKATAAQVEAATELLTQHRPKRREDDASEPPADPPEGPSR